LGTITQDNQGDNGILAWGGARTIENPFTWLFRVNANRSFVTLGTNQLTMSGAIDLSGGTNNVVRTFRIDNTAPTILSGVIGDAGANMGINKTGNGALYLNNANTYSGTTTITAGRLAGTGTIAGSLVVTNGQVGGGSAAAIGTLTVGGNATFGNNGGGFFRVNRSGSQSDKVSVTGTLANSGTGTITITNLGATLQAGDTFTLFNKAVTGGSTMKITGAGANWVNNLAVDGSVQVLNIIATYPTNISASVSGSTLTVSWPLTHLSWSLQAQTNSLSVGVANNWVTIPGTASVTSTNLAINPANPAVFYRLFYVAP
jgi:autotransporter-associated beta strand protein